MNGIDDTQHNKCTETKFDLYFVQLEQTSNLFTRKLPTTRTHAEMFQREEQKMEKTISSVSYTSYFLL